MRFLLLLILVAAAGGAYYFYHDAAFREKARGWRIADDDRERYEAYEKGKAIFKSTWPGASGVRFLAWGDEPGETAAPLNADGVTGDVWMARGHYVANKNGADTEEQWCEVFDRGTGAHEGQAVEAKAEDTLKKLDAGEFRKKPAPTAGSSAPVIPGAGAQKPAAGSWMWGKEGRGALDQPAKRDGS